MQYFRYQTTDFLLASNQKEGTQYVIPVEVNDQEAKAVIDTGSPVSFISYQAAENLNLGPDSRKLTETHSFVGGLPMPCSRVTTELHLSNSRDKASIEIEEHEFVVAKKTLQEMSSQVSIRDSELELEDRDLKNLIILGTDFLSKVRFRVEDDHFEILESYG